MLLIGGLLDQDEPGTYVDAVDDGYVYPAWAGGTEDDGGGVVFGGAATLVMNIHAQVPEWTKATHGADSRVRTCGFVGARNRRLVHTGQSPRLGLAMDNEV